MIVSLSFAVVVPPAVAAPQFVVGVIAWLDMGVLAEHSMCMRVQGSSKKASGVIIIADVLGWRCVLAGIDACPDGE